jgi:hypothetical protein
MGLMRTPSLGIALGFLVSCVTVEPSKPYECPSYTQPQIIYGDGVGRWNGWCTAIPLDAGAVPLQFYYQIDGGAVPAINYIPVFEEGCNGDRNHI